MKITDEAVQDSIIAWYEATNFKDPEDMSPENIDYSMRRALEAALPHLPAGYKVKPLEWVDVTIKKHYEHANSPFGQYRIIHYRFNDWRWMLVGDDGAIVKGPANSRKEAEASAKADFERRVRELIVDGVDVAEVRRQAFEEALQAIADLPTPYSLANKDGREDCCDVIRALSAAPTEGQQWSSNMDLAPSDTVILMAWFNSLQGGWEYEAGVHHSTRGGWRHGSATHWMPFPAAPTKEDA